MLNFVVGLLSAIGSALAYGSFGVPIKCKRIMDAKVNPLAYQFYKSSVCFLTSWLVLTYNPFQFTWWGTLGGLIWVINGVMAIVAIQKAGLGITQATWSALSIFVSFIWGAFIFKEPIKSLPLSFVGLILMALGMAGLGYSAHRLIQATTRSSEDQSASGEIQKEELQKAELAAYVPGSAISETTPKFALAPATDAAEQAPPAHAAFTPARDAEAQQGDKATLPAGSSEGSKVQFLIGIGLACLIGITNGSFIVPMKFAQKDVQGIIYVLSFGIGAELVTVAVGSAYACICLLLRQPVPSLQVKVAIGPASLTGLLWSIGNFLSIYAVLYLGLSLGWPIVQCQLIVSSLWGILYYKEIEGWITVVLFGAATAVILVGVFILAAYGV